MSRLRSTHARVAVLVAAFVLSVASLTAGVVVTFAQPAYAADLGPVDIGQSSGSVTSNPMFLTGSTPACPQGFGENANLRVGRPGGNPYSNLAPALGGGGFDTAPITINPNRSFQAAVGGPPGDGEWWVVMECYSLTEGRHPDEFRRTIAVCGAVWVAAATCPAAPPGESTTSLRLDPPASVEQGHQLTITATVVPATAAGTVSFYRRQTVDNAVQTVQIGAATPVNAGTATVTVSDLPLATGGEVYTIYAQFEPASGAGVVASLATKGPLEVREPGAAASTSVNLTFDKTTPQPPGTALQLNAAVTPPEATGNVEFSWRTATGTATVLGQGAVGDGVATFQLAAGHSLVGDVKLQARFVSSAPELFEDSPVNSKDFRFGAAVRDTTTTLAPSVPSPQVQGTSVTFTATVAPPEAAGTVKFLDGTNQLDQTQTLTGGTASVTAPSLAVGTHTIKAEYTPAEGAAFNPSSGTIQYVINAPGGGGGEEGELIATSGGVELGANPELERGQVVSLTGRGFEADEAVTITLDGVQLADVTAGADGEATYDFTVPDDAAEGAHQLLLTAASTELVFDFTVVVDAGNGGNLPLTGVSLIGFGIVGLALVGAGVGLMRAGRRRDQPEPVAWPDGGP